jgi:hypothetical protein
MLPETSHAWHCPPHAESQQKPSTQNPDAHWLAPLHGTAGPSLLWHSCVDRLQKLPDTQSLSPVHLVRHAVEPHTNGAHGVGEGLGQAPAPLQPAAGVSLPPVQLAERHEVVEGG